MRIVVLNSGSPQPILRTIALAKYCTIERFIEFGPRNANHELLESEGIATTFFSTAGSFRLISLARFLEPLQADAYVCHFAAGAHVYACLLARKAPVCLIAMGNDILYDDGDGRVLPTEKMLIRRSARRAELISAKSQTLKKRLLQWGVKGSILVNYWGVDHSVFKPGDMSAARQHLGLPINKKIILSPRAFEKRCNLHLVAESFKRLAAENPDPEIVFIGPPNMPGYVEQVRAIIDQAELSGRAHFRFAVGVRDVVLYYQAADVAVSVAGSEGFPNSVLEMLACKTPLVVGRIPQTEELLVDGQHALLCQLTVEDIHTKLRWMLDEGNGKIVRTMADKGHELSLEHADIEKNSERLVNELERVRTKNTRRFPWDVFFLVLVHFLVRKLILKSKQKA
jgi:glycosyltransferase involved in cell wall biosynthesis